MTPEPLDRILLIDKPAGMTSHDVVNAVRRHFGIRRVGHAGTLDPFATGLLILGVGKATKRLGALTGLDKSYEAGAFLGATSDTYDLDGVIRTNSVPANAQPDLQKIQTALLNFLGEIEQKAPAFSAKKVGGKKLYELARKGEDVEHLRPVKTVQISDIRILDYRWPHLSLSISCSSGTYIRSIVHDLGQILECGAYADSLRRTRIGTYDVTDAVPFSQISTLPTT